MIDFLKSVLQMIVLSGAVLMLVVGYMSYYGDPAPKRVAVKRSSGCDSLVMYSATWCGACKAMRADFKREGIYFTEYFVNQNHEMNKVFERKARAANIRIAYPTLEINGDLLPRNYYANDLKNIYNLCDY